MHRKSKYKVLFYSSFSSIGQPTQFVRHPQEQVEPVGLILAVIKHSNT